MFFFPRTTLICISITLLILLSLLLVSSFSLSLFLCHFTNLRLYLFLLQYFSLFWFLTESCLPTMLLRTHLTLRRLHHLRIWSILEIFDVFFWFYLLLKNSLLILIELKQVLCLHIHIVLIHSTSTITLCPFRSTFLLYSDSIGLFCPFLFFYAISFI